MSVVIFQFFASLVDAVLGFFYQAEIVIINILI